MARSTPRTDPAAGSYIDYWEDECPGCQGVVSCTARSWYDRTWVLRCTGCGAKLHYDRHHVLRRIRKPLPNSENEK